MPKTYINRKEDTYYLHEGKTRTCKPKYYFSKKDNGDLVDSIPAGYEIYENPNAQVFLRRKMQTPIIKEELEIVKLELKTNKELQHYIVDIKNNGIIIYIAEDTFNGLKTEFSELFPFAKIDKVQKILEKSLRYMPMLQFTLDDKETRNFIVQRYCFKGSIDDWIFLDVSTNLKLLAKKYCTHLGKESFYNLI